MVAVLVSFIIIPTAVAQNTGEPPDGSVPPDIEPPDEVVGPVAIVDELHQAHSNITNIMIEHADGKYDTANDLRFTMSLVNEDDETLEVTLDPILLSLGLYYDAGDIEDLLETEDIPITVLYGIFVPNNHINSSSSTISSWINLYNSRCVSPTAERLCEALAFNLRQNHYVLDSNNQWQKSTSNTLISTPITTPTPSAIPRSVIFSDDFDDGDLDKWIESGETDWRADRFDELTNPPGHPNDNNVAEADNCDTQCTITLKHPVDISSVEDPKLEFYRYVDESLDAGEYLKVEVTKDGRTWTLLKQWNATNSGGSGSDDDKWHKESYDLDQYKSSKFNVRFVTSMSSSSEEVGIDDVRITKSATQLIKSFDITNTSPICSNNIRVSGTGICSQERSSIVRGGEPFFASIQTTDSSGTTTNMTNLGTITVVTRNNENQLVAVSVSHVMRPVGSTLNVYQSNQFGSHKTIGTLGASTGATGVLESDAAYATLNSDVSYIEDAINYGGKLLSVGHYGGIEQMAGYPVLKMAGIYTDSIGNLQYRNATVSGYNTIGQVYTLTNQLSGSYVADFGDSGSPVFTESGDEIRLVGMHIGKSCQVVVNNILFPIGDVCSEESRVFSIFTPWESVAKVLKLE